MKQKGMLAGLQTALLLSLALLNGCGQTGQQPLLQTAAEIETSLNTKIETETEAEGGTEESEEAHVAYNGDAARFAGKTGCAVVSDIAADYYSNYNSFNGDKLWKEQASPDSTFKIVSTLIGLEEGILTSADTRMGYDGTDYGNVDWNQDLTLQEAFQTSCIWFFRKVLDEAGQETVQQYLDALSYGNCDISQWEGSKENSMEQLNGFWLESSLQISPKEQVDVLEKILRGESCFSKEHIRILKDIMLEEEGEYFRFYGKTGSGADGTNAWYVGFYETLNHTYCFAVRLTGSEKNRVTGNAAKEIARKLMEEYREEPFQKVPREEVLLEDGSDISGAIQGNDFEKLKEEAADSSTEEGTFGGTPCMWETISWGGREYFFVQLMDADNEVTGAPMLVNAAVTEESLVLKCGIHVGMSLEEARGIFPDLYEYYWQEGALPKNIIAWNEGTFPPEWCRQYHSVVMAEITYGEELPWYLGLFLDENHVIRAISTCYPTAG